MKYYLFALLVIFSACSHAPGSKPKATNVFIHGSHMDGEVWTPVIELLTNMDNMVVTLKGRAENEHISLTEMASDVCSKISIRSNLIVHSFGGAVANQMVGICPKKIERIIYVTAIVPLKGEQAFDLMSAKDQAAYGKAVVFTKNRIRPKESKIFWATFDPEISTKNIPMLTLYTESFKTGEDQITYDTTTFDKIPKCYIYTTKDPLISLATQEKYAKRITLNKTEKLEVGHYPMLSDYYGSAAAIRSCL
jgi:pimeloyl-ACP methyl ester carboxylesterase